MESPYQAIKHNTLADGIVEQIEKLVLNRKLQVGAPLPSERELAHELQVGRQALREAMRILAQKGLVQVLPGRGTFVAQPSADFLSDSLYTYLCLNPHLVRDFLETRRVIETEAAAIAAERAPEESLIAMEKAVDDMATHIADQNRWIDADLAFHTELARATGNQVILLLTLSLRDAMRGSIHYFASTPHIVSASVDLHRNVYNAVAARQVEAARRAMREHFQITLDEVGGSHAPLPVVDDEGSLLKPTLES
jgi:GntR family transcriptional regulator, transcriptional repressor for pyruvate dehydrogenase complex